MDMNVLQKLDKMPINEARIAAVALIDPKKTKKACLESS